MIDDYQVSVPSVHPPTAEADKSTVSGADWITRIQVNVDAGVVRIAAVAKIPA
jgi:hypothetical protein